jgi:SAM-dependent methyltransferase
MGDDADANRAWREMLRAWAIPEQLVAAAPESPYFFDPSVFIAAADEALARFEDTVSDRVARQALAGDGTVLDVGAGAGAASLRLRPSHVTGVDPSVVLLEAFAERAERLGVGHTEIEGTWPDVAARVPAADVVVCHHLAYNVPDLATFASQLAAHARRRVVIELTAVHPMAWLSPYWDALHGLVQPEGPTAIDAAAVFAALGFEVHAERGQRPLQMIGELGDDQLARIARRLCLAAERLPELRRLVTDMPPPSTRQVVTLWW